MRQQRIRFGIGLMVLALASTAAWAVTPPREHGGAVLAANDKAKPGADDHERGYSDGLNGKEARERDKDYRAGYSAGRAKHEANAARPDGRDYAAGYRDGFNRYRERAAIESKSRSYAAGFRAGQADHTARVVGSTPAAPTTRPGTAPQKRPSNVNELVGRPASALDGDMKALGYERMGQFKKGSESFTTWSQRGQSCVRVMTRDGRVKELSPLETDRCM